MYVCLYIHSKASIITYIYIHYLKLYNILYNCVYIYIYICIYVYICIYIYHIYKYIVHPLTSTSCSTQLPAAC